MILNLLEKYKISPTDHRIKVLEIILTFTGEFSAEDVLTAFPQEGLVLTKSVVNKILRLYCVRGIIRSVEMRKTSMRGRPELLFILNEC